MAKATSFFEKIYKKIINVTKKILTLRKLSNKTVLDIEINKLLLTAALAAKIKKIMAINIAAIVLAVAAVLGIAFFILYVRELKKSKRSKNINFSVIEYVLEGGKEPFVKNLISRNADIVSKMDAAALSNEDIQKINTNKRIIALVREVEEDAKAERNRPLQNLFSKKAEKNDENEY